MPDPLSSHQTLLQYLALGDVDPDAPAVTIGAGTRTYGDLRALAADWTGELRTQGVGEGTVVTTSLENSVELVALMLAVWELGGAVAPLNPLLGREDRSRALSRLEPGLFVAGRRCRSRPWPTARRAGS